MPKKKDSRISLIAGGFLIDYSFSMDTDKSHEEQNLGSLYELPVDCSGRGDQSQW